MANRNLTEAKKAKNDEFYTQFEDIQKELCHYKNHFEGKTIFCNCDDPTWSNFWRYFHLNFEHFKLKKLIATHYDPKCPTYKMEYEGGNDTDYEVGTITLLQQNGDFRSPECIELLKEADIVVTNPMFSLFREYVAQLIQYNKKFIIMGNMNAITYKEFFPLIKDNKVWAGYGFNTTIIFAVPDSYNTEKNVGSDEFGRKLVKVPAICWYTNLDIPKRHEPIDLVEHYDPERYPTYANYDAIECSRTLDIPCDYEPCWYKCPHAENCTYAKTEGKTDDALCEQARNGEIGVPISYLSLHNNTQFEIIGNAGSYNGEGSVASELFVEDGLHNAMTHTHTHTHQTQSLQENHYSKDASSVVQLSESQSLSSHIMCQHSSESLVWQQEIHELQLQEKCCNISNINKIQKIEADVESLMESDNMPESSFKNCHKCNGVMGVPISMLNLHCEAQHQIIGIACGNSWANYKETLIGLHFNPNIKYGGGLGSGIINGKAVYARILIRKVKQQ